MTTAATPTVPIGPTTVVGYGGTVVGLIASVLALIFPDGDEQTIALIASSVFTLGSFLVTQVGRYVQAKELARAQASIALIRAQPLRGTLTESRVSRPATDPDRPKDPAVDLVGDQDLPEG